jgi:protein SCO1/2
MNAKRTVVIAVLTLALGIAVGFFSRNLFVKPAPPAPPPGVQYLDEAESLTPFRLTDIDGKPFTVDQLKGHWTVMFFGYTHCPDVCPTTFNSLKKWRKTLREKNEPVPQVVFISVDPARDTTAKLAENVRYFDPEFSGATGSLVELNNLTQPMGAMFDYEDPETGEALSLTSPPLEKNYSVNHTASLFFINPRAQLVAYALPPADLLRMDATWRAMRGVYGDN